MKKQYLCKVVKISGDKTRKVYFQTTKQHKLYKKVLILNKYKIVHDENNISRLNDMVLIEECRPISKIKSFFIKKTIGQHDYERNNS